MRDGFLGSFDLDPVPDDVQKYNEEHDITHQDEEATASIYRERVAALNAVLPQTGSFTSENGIQFYIRIEEAPGPKTSPRIDVTNGDLFDWEFIDGSFGLELALRCVWSPSDLEKWWEYVSRVILGGNNRLNVGGSVPESYDRLATGGPRVGRYWTHEGNAYLVRCGVDTNWTYQFLSYLDTFRMCYLAYHGHVGPVDFFDRLEGEQIAYGNRTAAIRNLWAPTREIKKPRRRLVTGSERYTDASIDSETGLSYDYLHDIHNTHPHRDEPPVEGPSYS